MQRLPKGIARLMSKIQTVIPVTQSEIVIAMVLCIGAIAGLVLKHIPPFPTQNTEEFRSELVRLADSLASAEITRFTGVTPEGTAVQELARADTIIRRRPIFPSRPTVQKITSGKIRLNTASMQELMRLPGVGEATAQKIIEARQQRPFSTIEDIMRVRGIGKKKFEAMRPFLDL
ncbi:MAG: helix-hairpin-helix domain-containing protein [Bacteroidota bacterium]|nr:helix-hairpin-helix domain-containing protein [Candidatus Kapabacteria bacterium]MDW8219778.1 helix-hairpin-helix domain-containing protein [Bacteroidota bacterium]